MSKVSVVAKLTVKPDKVDAFPAAWDDLLAHIDDNEPGTEHYVLHQSTSEPTVFYGPFVMNTREEVYQAMQDYHAGKLGQIPAEWLRK